MTSSMMRLVLGCALASACYTTHIVSGVPPAGVAPMAQDRWHHTVVLGIAEISPPVDLEADCSPKRWAEIKEELTFLNGVVSGVTSSIYTPRTYTVTCGAASGSMPHAVLP